MKVGDLVVQLGWETDGLGIVTRMLRTTSLDKRARVQWPNGEVDMYQSQLMLRSRRQLGWASEACLYQLFHQLFHQEFPQLKLKFGDLNVSIRAGLYKQYTIRPASRIYNIITCKQYNIKQ